jgi:STE24 endopeptidase
MSLVESEIDLQQRGKRYRQWQQAGAIVGLVFLYAVVAVWSWTGLVDWFDGVLFEAQSPYFFSATAALAIAITLSLPYCAFQTYLFALEYRFGFLKMSAWKSARHIGKAAVYVLIVVSLAVTFLAWSFLYFPSGWWVVVPTGLLIWRAVQTTLYPRWLSLFHEVETLTDSDLLKRLKYLEERANLRVRSYRVIHIDQITTKANAWVSGAFGIHHVLLSDTLLHGYTEGELEAIVAHEFGHVRHHDVIKRLAFIGPLEVGGFWLLSWFGSSVLALKVDTLEDIAAFVVCASLVMLYSRIFLTRIARKQEVRADEYALAISDPVAFSSAMGKLKRQNLITYEKGEESKFSHPAMDERISRADELAAKQAAGSSD